MSALENQHRRRDRLRAEGLTTEGTPRLDGRRVVSWSRGPYHLPTPGPTGRCAAGCGRRVRRNGSGWRHR